MGQAKHSTEKREWEQLSEQERYKIEALSKQGCRLLNVRA